MRIPVGNFGNQVANPSQSRGVPAQSFVTQGLEQVGSNIERVGATLEANEQTRLNKLEAERVAAAREADRIASITAQATTKNQLADLHDSISRGLVDGTYDKAKVGDMFKEQSQKIVEDALKNVPEQNQELVKASLLDDIGGAQRQISGLVDRKNREDIGNGINSYMEQMQRYAQRGPAQLEEAIRNVTNFVSVAGPQGGINPQKAIQTFKEGAVSNFVVAGINTNMDNYKGLANIKKSLEGDKYPDLDPAKKNALLHSISGQMESLQRRYEMEAARRDRENNTAFTAAMGVVQAGKSLAPEYAAQLAQRFKGTPYEKALASMIAEAPASQSFSAQPVKAQDALMQELLAKGNDPKRGWTPEEQKQYKQWEAVNNKTKADIKNDPFQAAQERGVISNIAPLQITDIATMSQQLGVRKQQADLLRQWTGIEQSPFRPEEAKQVAGLIEELPVNQRASALGMIAKQVTPGQMRAISSQFGAKSTSLATAGFYAAGNYKTSSNTSVGEIYLRGDEALKQGTVKIDTKKETGVKAEIYKTLDGVYSSTSARDAAVDSAYKIYAGLRADGIDDVDKAIRVATGGVMNYNGNKIPKPYGWTDSEVRDAVSSFNPDAIRALSGGKVYVGNQEMSAEDFTKMLPAVRLKTSPLPDTYTVEIGSRTVLGANGQPFYLPLKGRR